MTQNLTSQGASEGREALGTAGLETDSMTTSAPPT
jgi:hypothetical protein